MRAGWPGTVAALVLTALAAPGEVRAQASCTPTPLVAAASANVVVGGIARSSGFASTIVDAAGLRFTTCLAGNGTPDGTAANPCFFSPVEAGNDLSVALGRGLEAFWHLADNRILTTGPAAVESRLVAAVESTYLTISVTEGAQIQFQRLRIRADVNATGIYTFDHPWGTRQYTVTVLNAGSGLSKGEINDTVDIPFASGEGTAGVVAPFLAWNPAIAPAAPAGFVGDGFTPHAVTGSPCGRNLVRITAVALDGVTPLAIDPGDADGDGRVDAIANPLFTVMGQLAPAGALADVSVTRSSLPGPARSGRDLVHTITASNAGPSPATAVTLAERVPANAAFVWASPGCTQAGDVVTCPIGSLAVGASAQRKVVVRPAAAGTVAASALLWGAEGDPVPANNAIDASLAVNASPAAGAVQRYRLFSPVTLEHLYTTDLNEYNVLGAFVGTWVQEGPVGKVFDNPGAFNGVTATPYYRLYNTANAQHHWTTDPNEYYLLGLFPQYASEGVDGWIFPTQAPGTIPLYRLLYPFSVPVAGLHHWTIDAVEYNALIASFGWIGEGGSGFVIP